MPAADPSSRTLSLGTGLRYHVLEWGAADAALDHTVVLLHGFLDFAWTWEETVAAALAGRFHLVAPDMRGHGDSDRVGAGGYYHFMDYLADLDEVIAQTARARLSLVGHSMGGSIAGYWAGTFPARLARLALLEGTGPPESSETAPERVASWISGWRHARGRAPRRYADVAAAAAQLRRNDPLLGEALSLRLAERGTAPAGAGAGAGGERVFKHDPLHVTTGPYGFRLDAAQEFWRRVTCPVLLVDGGESFFHHEPAEAERRHACFADRRHAVLPGAGHMMQRHQPAALARLLAEFLS
ncbi:MAG TPA: alpha/beta hydrolase [Myxococcota bacterium]|nr:alpha/beta hydrolase [Myxococcota bacterium]